MSRFLALTAAACVEYDLDQELPEWPEPNPPELADVTHEDVITQVTIPIVDVLWVIDNSCSMTDEQNALAQNFPGFMDYFIGSGLDYHVGVISTDLDDPAHQGKLRDVNGAQWIAPETYDPIAVFTSMATMGTTGTGTERGLGATYLALEANRETFNEGYYREEAAIHTIVISDEEDSTQDSLVSKSEFVDWYDALKLKSTDRTFSSIVTMSGFDRGEAYLDVSAEIGGIIWDISNTDWDEVLDRLGVQASGLRREYFLSRLPVEGTIEVEVHDPSGTVLPMVEAEGDPVVGDWTYTRSRNSITFLEYMPEPLARVVIRYTVLASAQDPDLDE